MLTMSPTTTASRTFSRPRAAPTLPDVEPSTVAETVPPLKSPQFAELLDKVENAEREKREQEALALLGRLAAFD